MTILTRTRPSVKPLRHTARPATPFGLGLLPASQLPKTDPAGTCPLPTIHGAGLSMAELFRVNGARNRAKAAYAAGCPDATFGDIDRVGDLAAGDELRRTLRDRPAAPAPVVEPTPEPVAAPAPRVTSPRPVASRPIEVVRRTMPFSAADLAWHAANSPTRNFGYDVLVAGPAPIRGGAPVRRNRWEDVATESAAHDSLERGLIPHDVADYIASTSLVGHPA